MTTQLDPNRLVGTVLGSRFEILNCVAFDDAGARYQAQDSELGDHATVRVLHRVRPDDMTLRSLLSLLTEVSSIDLPGLKNLRAVGRTRTRDVYYATDEILGKSLAQRLELGALTPEEALSIVASAGETLGKVHDHGIVHGALHPGAIIFPQRRDSREPAKVLDFGLGPLILATDVLPMGNRSAATPYQSPEQAKNEDFDHRTDIYSLGVILFECLAGRPPFAGASALEVLAHQLQQETPRLSEIKPGLEGSPLQDVIDRSMTVEPRKRYSSMESFVSALKQAAKVESTRKINAPTRAPSHSSAPQAQSSKPAKPIQKAPPKRRRRRKKRDLSSILWYSAGAVLIVSALVGLILYSAGAFEREVERPTPIAHIEDQPDDESQEQVASQTQKRRSQEEGEPNEALQKAIRAQTCPLPPRALRLVQEGNEAMAEGRYRKAISRFSAAKRSAPTSPEVARGLGFALLHEGQINAASRELKRYLELDPRAPDAARVRQTLYTLGSRSE